MIPLPFLLLLTPQTQSMTLTPAYTAEPSMNEVVKSPPSLVVLASLQTAQQAAGAR